MMARLKQAADLAREGHVKEAYDLIEKAAALGYGGKQVEHLALEIRRLTARYVNAVLHAVSQEIEDSHEDWEVQRYPDGKKFEAEFVVGVEGHEALEVRMTFGGDQADVQAVWNRGAHARPFFKKTFKLDAPASTVGKAIATEANAYRAREGF